MSKRKYGRRQVCPCGKSTKYCPLISSEGTGGGKCHSTKCGQRFFKPEPKQAKLAPLQLSDARCHTYHDINDKPVIRVEVKRDALGKKQVVVYSHSNGSWKLGLGDAIPIPYRLPEVVQAIAQQRPILVLEGEKDCDTAYDNGFDATTNLFGALKWRDEYSDRLCGMVAVIISDNDDVGRQHGSQVEESLRRRNAAETVVQLDIRRLMPDLPDKGDLTDFFERGGSVEAIHDEISRLLAEADSTPEPVCDVQIPLPAIEHSKLPTMLRTLIESIEDPNESLALLLASMTALGSIMPTITTKYAGRDYAPMLYLFVVGEAGTGKSIILPARKLVAGIEDIHREFNRSKAIEFRRSFASWAKDGKKNGEPCPREHDFHTLLGAPDSTAPVIIRDLSANKSILIFDTEADSLQSAISTKNGDASSVLRKAWHHEPIAQSRVGGSLRVHCDRPNLAMILSGTPAQILPLVQGSENGLVSRISFLQLYRHLVFKNPFDASASVPNARAESLAPLVTKLWLYAREGDHQVDLSDAQKKHFNDFYKVSFETNDDEVDGAVTLRSAVVVVRLCTILAVLRCYEAKGMLDDIMEVTDEDFSTAMELGAYLRLSSGDIVERLRSLAPTTFPTSNRARVATLYSTLPGSFSTADAHRIGMGLGLNVVAINRYLAKQHSITRVAHGRYEKQRQHPP